MTTPRPGPATRTTPTTPTTPSPDTVGVARAVVRSPIGALVIDAHDGAITRLELRTEAPRAAPGSPSDPVLAAAVGQIVAYLAGDLREFDLPLRLEGTPFQQEVWAALRAIPYGETITYAELAARVGRPRAHRAVGSANGRNPVAIVVPCHRVVASGGGLGGYAYGLEAKRWLLDLERRR